MELGVLLPQKRYSRLLAEQFEPWRTLAVDQERRFGVRTLFLSPRNLDLQQGRAQVAVATPLGWREEFTNDLPMILHNRLSLPLPAEAQVLRDLNGVQSTTVFNETNRWHRGLTAAMLTSCPASSRYVPPTVPFTATTLAALEPGLYLLAPSRRPLRGESLLLELNAAGHLQFTRVRDGSGGTLPLALAFDALRHLASPRLRWLCRLPGWPAGPDGPVEWRLYVLRGDEGGWTIGGAVAKRDALRPARQKERTWPFADGLALTFGAEGDALVAQLQQAALAVVTTLALYQPGIAHCAVDFWIDRMGHVVLADLAGGYRTDWLRKSGDLDALQRVLDHPVRFTQVLARTGVDKLHVDFGRGQ